MDELFHTHLSPAMSVEEQSSDIVQQKKKREKTNI